jgi:hypothetical protein
MCAAEKNNIVVLLGRGYSFYMTFRQPAAFGKIRQISTDAIKKFKNFPGKLDI